MPSSSPQGERAPDRKPGGKRKATAATETLETRLSAARGVGATASIGSSPAARVTAPVVAFGREILGDLTAAESREWIVTNGLGGLASGTVAGSLTRRYHGLLMAALSPPLGRTLLLAKLEEVAVLGERTIELSTNRWAGGALAPAGHVHAERFRLEGTTPVWTVAIEDIVLEKRVWMTLGENTTHVRYEHRAGDRSITLRLRPLVNYRDHHSTTEAGEWRFQISPTRTGLEVRAFESAVPFTLSCPGASVTPEHVWYRGFDLPAERERGLSDREDHLSVGTFEIVLQPGGAITFTASAEHDPAPADESVRARRAHEERLVTALPPSPPWIEQLALAADEFVAVRALGDGTFGKTIVAGYHWFGDWGRDTMIALPGLTLATGRPEVAAEILRTFARFLDRGMLPNVFPSGTETPEYNTVDATLWYVEAVRKVFEATSDLPLLRELFPSLTDIVTWHERGTRYGIALDPSDGLLRAGEPGVQLTWMDARVGDWVVTPRIGKPVEVNALWLNALASIARFATLLGESASRYAKMAERARKSAARFWNVELGYCFDVIDGPDGDDPSLRPNQIFCVSLPESPFDLARQRAIVDVCARRLLAGPALRSLAGDHPSYVGRYGGGPAHRDGSYHQGTAWGWLLGPFIEAHLRVYGDPDRAASFLLPVRDHLLAAGLGTASEIFDGDPPFTARGCIAQAWTVSEVLRAHRLTQRPL